MNMIKCQRNWIKYIFLKIISPKYLPDVSFSLSIASVAPMTGLDPP